MSIMSYCRRPACTASADETLEAAAQRMEKEGIGLIAVTEGARLVGVLTDRDIALHVAAGGRDASEERIGDAMTRSPVSVQPADSVEHALSRMASAHVRRLLVVDGDQVEGIVSADDLTLLLARELGGLGDVLVAQLPAGASRSFGAAEGQARWTAAHRQREVVTASEEAPITEVAQKMEEWGVGSVVLTGAGDQASGLLTDRDLALRVVAAGRDPATTTAASVMSKPLTGAHPDDSLEEVVSRMRTAGVRRMPLLEEGRAVGIVTFDDLLVSLARDLDRLADCVKGEMQRARVRSYSTRMRHGFEGRFGEVTSRLRAAGDQTWRTLGRELDQMGERVGAALRGTRPKGRGSLLVRDLMRSDVRTCLPEDALSEPARIMWERDCGCVPVLAGDGSGRVVGMITDRDICMAACTSQARLAEMQVKEAMSQRVFSCHPDDTLAEAEAIMRSTQVRRLPVVDEDGHLRGIFSLADVAEGAAGLRAPAGSVSPSEVGQVLEAICRPRSQLIPR